MNTVLSLNLSKWVEDSQIATGRELQGLRRRLVFLSRWGPRTAWKDAQRGATSSLRVERKPKVLNHPLVVDFADSRMM